MSLKCDVVMDLSAMYHEGTVSESSASEIKEHLAQCPECRRFYAEYRAMLKRRHNLDPVDDTPESDFTELACKLKHRRVLLFSGLALYGIALAGLTAFLLLRDAEEAEEEEKPCPFKRFFARRCPKRQKTPRRLFQSLPWR